MGQVVIIQFAKGDKLLKKITRVIFFIFALAGCNRNNNVTIELFNPNPLLSPINIYDMKLARVPGLDVDVFEFFNNDTIIYIETNENMVFSQNWLIPVDNLITLDDMESFFEEQYNVVTYSKDTVITINQEEIITFYAYSRKNKLSFYYRFADLKNHTEFAEKAIIVYYYFPEYEKYLKN